MALTFLDKKGLEQLWSRIGSVYQTKLTIDSALSSTSTNPVQNRAINSQITSITNSINSITGNVSTIQSQVTNINNTVNSLNTNAITGITVSGNGNVISEATKNGKVITFTKGNITASGLDTYTTGLTLTNANASDTGVTLTGTIRLNNSSTVTGSTTVPFSMMQTYVDGRISNQIESGGGGNYLPLSGGTVIGNVYISTNQNGNLAWTDNYFTTLLEAHYDDDAEDTVIILTSYRGNQIGGEQIQNLTIHSTEPLSAGEILKILV